MGLSLWIAAARDLYLLRGTGAVRLATRKSLNITASVGMSVYVYIVLLDILVSTTIPRQHTTFASAGWLTLGSAAIFASWAGLMHGVARLSGGTGSGRHVFKAVPPLFLQFSLAFAPLLAPWLRAVLFAWTMLGFAEVVMSLHKLSALRTGMAVVIPLALLYGLNLAVAEGFPQFI